MSRWFSGTLILAACQALLAAPASRPASQPAARALTMRGVVFEDLNGDGVREENEPALADMPVSDGLSIVKTPADGRFEFRLRERTRGSVFVCTPAGWRASKSFYAIADFARFADAIQPADIGLVRDPARNTDRFCFVQLTDTHVTAGQDTVGTMIDDLHVVNDLTDAPAFIVATGDLVNDGNSRNQFAAYAGAMPECRFPIYNVVGNHDYGGKSGSTGNYEQALGPPYYSFDAGPYHFIAKDIIARDRQPEAYQRQVKWIEEDIRLNGHGKRLIVLQHFLPTLPELDWWAERDAAAIFSGHWHGRRERVYKGILDVNSATLRFGGIDRSPRGFRVVHVDGGALRCEWRVGGQHQRLEIVQPAVGGQVSGRDIHLRVIAYDTAVGVARVHYRILDARQPADAKPLGEGDLWAEGSWSWAGRWNASEDVAAGEKRIHIQATAADGRAWQKEGSFTLADGEDPVVRPGAAWPFFHNDAGHRGFLSNGPTPPLSVAWAANIGGTIHVSSPVIADGRVYAASSYESSLSDCAVIALDLQTGRQIWRAPVDSSIEHSPAAWGGNVLAVSQAGTLYCLDRDGFPRWTRSLDRGHDDRWETSFPVADEKAVYAGRCSGFGAYDVATGAPLWRQPGGKDWWPHLYGGPSLGQGVVYQGGPFVRALDPRSGDIRWAKTDMVVSTVAVVPAAVEQNGPGERLYVFHNKNTLRCLDGKSGNVVWEARLRKPDGSTGEVVPLGDETGTPAVGADVVCLGGAEVSKPDTAPRPAAMYGFDKATGALRWSFAVGREIAPTLLYKRESSTITSSPVIVGNIVYFGASDGWLYALDANDGRCMWKYWFGLPIASTAAVSGNTIILTTWDGTIYAMAAETR